MSGSAVLLCLAVFLVSGGGIVQAHGAALQPLPPGPDWVGVYKGTCLVPGALIVQDQQPTGTPVCLQDQVRASGISEQR